MKKHLTVIAISFAFMIALFAGATAVFADDIVHEGNVGDNITWKIDSSGTLSFEGEGAIPDYGRKLTPWGTQQEEAPRYAFNKIVIGEGITRIGSGNFCCSQGITEVKLPSTLTSIGDAAFWGMMMADGTDIIIPNSVKTLGTEAFAQIYNCGKVVMSDQIKTIPYMAFYQTGKTIIVGKNVESINKYAFMDTGDYCVLQSIIFKNDADYESVNLRPDDGNVDIYRTCTGGVAFMGSSIAKKNKTVPAKAGGYDVVKIGSYAFDSNNKLVSVTMPKSVKTIGPYAFYSCSKLANVKMGSDTETISKFAFYGCNSLEAITLPNSIKTIGKRAFWHCYSLEKIKIPATVQTIEQYAFGKCTGLETVTIGDVAAAASASSAVPKAAAYSKTDMTAASMATSKNTRIKKYAFNGCKSLRSVVIGKRVKNIGVRSFAGCSALKILKIKTTKLTGSRIGSGAFKGVKTKIKVYVPKSKYKYYKKILRKKGISKKAKFIKVKF